jgi:serine/threonine protein phosphatase 1
MGRTLVIGDIHGAARALEQVLMRAKILPTDKLIFLGDYVDGWSESAQVLDYLLELDKSHNCTFIKGNHDVWCEDWLQTNIPDRKWLMHGGAATVESYYSNQHIDKKKHLMFIEKMPYYHIDEAKNLYVHAGFTSMHGPEKEFHKSTFNWDRTLWEVARSIDPRLERESLLYPIRLKLFNEIFIGHTPTTYYDSDKPMQGCNVWNVDTGAAFTGKLTILDAATKEIWQSDKVMDLYPNEMGRN